MDRHKAQLQALSSQSQIADPVSAWEAAQRATIERDLTEAATLTRSSSPAALERRLERILADVRGLSLVVRSADRRHGSGSTTSTESTTRGPSS